MALPADLAGRLRLPVIAAPMFLVSGPELVAATTKAGVIGAFPTLNCRSTEDLGTWLDMIEARQRPEHAPHAVNLIVHRSNARLDADLKLIVERRVPIVITSLGARPDIVAAVQAYGGLVFHDVVSRRHAEKAAQAGVDGIIAIAAGAGGHSGTLSPFAILAEVRSVFGGIVILAGGITSGRDIAAARVMGADLVSMGTRFIATDESRAAPAYKRMIIETGADEIVATAALTGVTANFLGPSLEAAGGTSAGPIPPSLGTGPGSKVWRDIWSAGHGVSAIDDLPSVAALCERLERSYREAMPY